VAERVVLHVGLMKSGTSFIQEVLRTNQGVLRDQGVLFPSPWRRQVQAVRDVIGHGDGDQPPLDDGGPWRSLVSEVRSWPGTAVVSMEFLGPRGRTKTRQILAELAPAEVEVVISVRDLARTIPAMWQETLQNRGTWTWEEYLAGVGAEDRSTPGPGRAFWHRQDGPGITEVWQVSAGSDRVVVLTVPPAGAPRGLLWERFASLLPIGGEGIDLDVAANPSLGLASLQVLQRLNQRLETMAEPLTPAQYERVVKRLLAKRWLAGRAGDPRLGYEAAWVSARGDRDLARLRELRPRVLGDLEELRCRPVPGSDPHDVTADMRLEAALDAVQQAVVLMARRPERFGSDADNSAG
jgi:hypothetical protein